MRYKACFVSLNLTSCLQLQTSHWIYYNIISDHNITKDNSIGSNTHYLYQLERLLSEISPAISWLPILGIHIEDKVANLKILPKIQILEFFNFLYMQHTFWSCLMRCVNMKCIQLVLWKLQSRHNSVHRWTDRRTDRWTDDVKPVYPPFNFVEVGGIIKAHLTDTHIEQNEDNVCMGTLSCQTPIRYGD